MRGPLEKRTKKHSEARLSRQGLQIVSLLAACDNKTKQNEKKLALLCYLGLKWDLCRRKQMVTPCL